MKQLFRNVNLRPDSLALIDKLNTIIEDFQSQGYRLTLRQLYYQCVSRNMVPNTEKSYKRVGGIVSDGRLAGLIDWDAIEDRGRVVDVPSEWDNLQSLARGALRAYRLPRWAGQEYYVELWVEKQALAGVLEPLAQKAHVPLMVNKGYSSQSAMHASAERFNEHPDQKKVLLYLGDHDPSGEDMVRDVRDRLAMFEVDDLEVIKVALTTAQVREYDPPPNPAKMSDSRAEAYVAIHGHSSWEVDALDPPVLGKIINSYFAQFIDYELMRQVTDREKLDKAALEKALTEMPDATEFIEGLNARRGE
jgi:hypothetical protein